MGNIDIKQYEGLNSGETMTRLLAELGKINDDLVVLGADVLGLAKEFSAQYPNRVYNFGIAEQNMIAAAAGFAKFGKIPVTELMGFLVARVAEQIRDEVCYNNQNVKIYTHGCGLNMAPGGVSHHADVDISILRSFPNMTIVQPASPKAIIFLGTKAILEFKGPVYFRLSTGLGVVEGSGCTDNGEIYENDNLEFEIGKAITLQEGNDVTLIASGLPVQLAFKATKSLLKEGISARLIDMHTIKPIDQEIILKAARETNGIVTIEDGSTAGGLGAAVCSLVCNDYPTRVKQIGFPNDKFTVIGSSEEELWNYYGLNVDNVVKEVKNIMITPKN